MTIGKLLAATMLGTALIASGPALAGPKHCPPGHAKKGWCSPHRSAAPHYRERHRERRRERHYDRDDDNAYQRGFLDGLATGWSRGDYLPGTDYTTINNYYDYGWRRPEPGERYVLVDGKHYLIKAATGLILDLLLN